MFVFTFDPIFSHPPVKTGFPWSFSYPTKMYLGTQYIESRISRFVPVKGDVDLPGDALSVVEEEEPFLPTVLVLHVRHLKKSN